MFRRVRQSACVLLLALPALAPAQDTRATLQEIARDLPFLDALGFLAYGRLGRAGDWHGVTEPIIARYHKGMQRLCDRGLPEKDLVALLKDKEASMRALALVALFDRQDARHLPHFHALCGDAAKTLPAPMPDVRSFINPLMKEEPLKLREQTVADVARHALDAYFQASNLHGFTRGPRSPALFEAYWKSRQDRACCVGWYVLKFHRASMLTTRESSERTARLHTLRKEIDGLPKPDRAWVLLRFGALHDTNEFGITEVATQEEIIRAASTLGPEKLLAVLEGKNPSGDPDLDPAQVHLARLPVFILKNAVRLLDADAGKRLLELEKESKHAGGPWWAIAASELAPGEAPRLLKAAMTRLRPHNDTPLFQALWRLAGPKELPFVLDWYYKPASDRQEFLQSALADRPKEGKGLLRAIVQDKRFLFIDWPTLDRLIPEFNRVAGKVIIGDDERRGLSHPLGMAHFASGVTRPDASYAKANELVFTTLADWRGRIEAEVTAWK